MAFAIVFFQLLFRAENGNKIFYTAVKFGINFFRGNGNAIYLGLRKKSLSSNSYQK